MENSQRPYWIILIDSLLGALACSIRLANTFSAKYIQMSKFLCQRTTYSEFLVFQRGDDFGSSISGWRERRNVRICIVLRSFL